MTFRRDRPLTLFERKAATDRTLHKFRDRPFDWHGASCIHLARTQAVNMGHRVPMLAPFRTAVGAAKALRATGHNTLSGLLDSLFVPIVPARMLAGDLCAGPPDQDAAGFCAIGIADGHGNIFGWHEADGAKLSTIKFATGQLTGAWRLGQ